MINIFCSLQDHHKERQKLCCLECNKKEHGILPLGSHTSSEQEIIQGLINISDICVQLIQNDDYQCLGLWNRIIHTMINSNYIFVNEDQLRFPENIQLSLQEVLFLINEQLTQLIQYINQIANTKANKTQLILQKKLHCLDFEIYGQQKQLIFRKEPFSFQSNNNVSVSFAELSLDGTILVIASRNMIRICSVQSNQIITEFQYNFDEYCHIAISQNNQMIAYMGDLGQKLFLRNNLDKFNFVKEFNIPQKNYDRILFDWNDIYLIYGTLQKDFFDQKFSVYNVKNTSQIIFPFNYLQKKSFSDNNKLIAVVNYCGIVEIWNFKQRKRLIKQYVGNRNEDLNFSPSSNLLLTAGYKLSFLIIINIWKIIGMKNQLIKLFEINLGFTREKLISCFFSDFLILSKVDLSGYINIHKTDSRKKAQNLKVLEESEYYIKQQIIKSSDLRVLIYRCKRKLQMWKVLYV